MHHCDRIFILILLKRCSLNKNTPSYGHLTKLTSARISELLLFFTTPVKETIAKKISTEKKFTYDKSLFS